MIREVNYNELYNLYIIKNMRRKDVAAYYGITEKQLCHYLAKVGIKKSRSLASKNSAKSKNHKLKQEKLENFKNLGLTEEVLSDLLFNKLLLKTEIASMYSISRFDVLFLCKEYNLIRDRKIEQKARERHLLETEGLSNVYQRKEVKEKIRDTQYKNNTGNYAFNNKEKVLNTLHNKYGNNINNVSQIPEVKEKIINTKTLRYGSNYGLICNNSNVKYQKNREIILSKNNLEKWAVNFIDKNKKKPKLKDLAAVLYIDSYILKGGGFSKYIKQYNLEHLFDIKDSSLEIIFKTFLENNSIKYKRNDRTEIYPQEIDFYLPEYKIGIEINDIVSHNSTIGFFGEPKDKKYHYEKSKTCEEKGIRLIHIWEWEIRDTNKWEKVKQYILNILKPKEKIYARKCILKEVPSKDNNEFLNKYHLQNTCKGQVIRLGLYYRDELIQVMTFGKPRFNKNYEYELLRLCTKPGYAVTGGAKKLFTHFIKIYKPKSVISYCDNSKFNGNVYIDLGFTLNSKIQLNYYWTNGKYTFSRYKTQKHKLNNLLKNFNSSLSESINMKNNGFVQVYDSGQLTYNYIGDENE